LLAIFLPVCRAVAAMHSLRPPLAHRRAPCRTPRCTACPAAWHCQCGAGTWGHASRTAAAFPPLSVHCLPACLLA
jgi:hypothetical protein